jgi:antitoxin component YwqK of YwqJK toxin-antitoxin module
MIEDYYIPSDFGERILRFSNDRFYYANVTIDYHYKDNAHVSVYKIYYEEDEVPEEVVMEVQTFCGETAFIGKPVFSIGNVERFYVADGGDTFAFHTNGKRFTLPIN